jgi:hypothetical protein
MKLCYFSSWRGGVGIFVDFKSCRFGGLLKLNINITNKEEPTLSHCAWARTFDLVIRWQI